MGVIEKILILHNAVQSVPAEILRRNYEVTRSFIRECWERERLEKKES